MTEPILPLAIRRHAAARPLAVAVREPAGERTWADLDRAADAAAAGLHASGVRPGDRVVLLTDPSADAIAIVVGILRAGAVAVPLGTRLTRREVGLAIAEVAPALLVRDAALAGLAAVQGVPDISPAELVARASGVERRGVGLDPTSPAVAVLTSGTTGRPKAALLTHRALAASAEAWTEALPPATGWLLCLGLAHVAGLGVAWRALGAGVALATAPADDPAAILGALGAGDAPASHVSLVPTQLARLLDAAAGTAPPPGLRAALVGGAPVPPELVLRASAAGWPVVVTYGLTEAGSGVTALPADEAAAVPSSTGRPLPRVAVRIAEPGPDGVGEIEVATPAAFSGYLGRDADSAAAFTADGWLRTGDVGRLDAAARLFVVDRREDLIVAGGENVVPAEVEAVLASHPAIAEAGVAARPDPTWGSVPVAGIVPRAEDAGPAAPTAPDDAPAAPDDDALRAWCRERLAPYKVPAAFVRLEALPRTASGKLRRRALREVLTPLVVVLHATLSTGRQLAPLVRELAARGDLRVLAPDRRGSGTRRLDSARPVEMDEHLADLAALLDDSGAERALLVGHSFGGVVAVEAAARLPDRVAAVVAYEPPYGAIGDAEVRRAFDRIARSVAEAHAADGRAGAARAFIGGVAGQGAWDAMPARTRAFLETEGGGALADASMSGLDPAGLGRIVCPVTILTGGASEPFYGSLADALADRIPGARRLELPGLRHTAPITDPGVLAAAIRAAIADAGIVPSPLETPA